ncbi:sulfotransferase domain-containing protein [Gynuella sunshinyii]|uniref:Tryptophanase n=1 Tax=Gynuella sunshinyii YC6258 TaxID=1445510 RepID=A0A0C5W4V0_9GAMM|nr:sulfotransferase domain-containing protein [Gynuella sunshinyii]AJQ97634.1 tryptophanase [Gynuella sunshinyii YC6258]
MNQMISPVKTTELQKSIIDSTIWNDFQYRNDDIVIGTYSKSGTTWMQQIVSQLIFSGEETHDVAEISPWLDFAFSPKEAVLAQLEAQAHRRFIKTHLPADALLFNDNAKYIYIGRDGRDVLWSLYNHVVNIDHDQQRQLAEKSGKTELPQMPRLDMSVVEYFHYWLDHDGEPFWSFWHHIRSWWSLRNSPNVYLVHFANLKQDMAGEIRRIADFIEQPIDESVWPDILQHCSFEHMKSHAEKYVPAGGSIWKGGARTFMNKGNNGRWRDVLSAAEIEKYEQLVARELDSDCAHWLATGELR